MADLQIGWVPHAPALRVGPGFSRVAFPLFGVRCFTWVSSGAASSVVKGAVFLALLSSSALFPLPTLR